MGAPAPITPDAVRSGNREAIAAWFRRDRVRLLAVASRIVSAHDAEDAVQDAFVSTLKDGHGFRGDAAPSTWMHRVTINAALMQLRTRRRRPADSLEELGDDVMQAVEPTHELGLEREDAAAELRDVLAHIKPLDRQILTLRLVDELSTEDTARVVGLSVAATKTRLSRVRAALRSLIGDCALAHTLA